MDAITLLKDDHASVEKLFRRFEEAGDRAHVEKRKVVDSIIEELSVHAAIEEQLFYPVTRATVPAVEDEALESLEEHHIVKWVLDELESLPADDERFDAKVTVLIENVRHHVKEEEGEYFPAVRAELGRKALTELGDAMAEARATAPTSPHPRSPDTPPGNVVAGAAAGVVDKVGDTVSGLAQGGVAAAQDVVDRVRGRSPRRPSPTGPGRTRRTARSVRGGADETLDRVIAAVQAARAGAAEVADDVGSGVADTAKAAKTSAKRTTGTAKAGAKKTARSAETAARRTTGTAKAGAKKTAGTARGAARRTASDARQGADDTVDAAEGS